jgi:hypothetical protein
MIKNTLSQKWTRPASLWLTAVEGDLNFKALSSTKLILSLAGFVPKYKKR